MGQGRGLTWGRCGGGLWQLDGLLARMPIGWIHQVPHQGPARHLGGRLGRPAGGGLITPGAVHSAVEQGPLNRLLCLRCAVMLLCCQDFSPLMTRVAKREHVGGFLPRIVQYVLGQAAPCCCF
jgi:hypothetical protein